MAWPFKAIFGVGPHGMASPHHWALSLGAKTATGEVVDQQNALGLSAVYRCVAILAESEAQLPIDVGYKEGAKRISESDHPLDYVLNIRANEFMSAFTFRSTIMRHAVTWGNGYAEIQRDGMGNVVALWPLLPDRTWCASAIRNDRACRVFQTIIDGVAYELPYDKVLHIPALSYDGFTGQGPVELARESLGLSLALEKHGSKYFKHELQSGGWIGVPHKLSDTARDNLRASVEAQGGLERAHRVKVLEEGAEFHASILPNDDAQFLETRQFQVAEAGRWFGIPLHMLGSETGATSWGTGITQISLGFVRYTMQPWLLRWEQEMDYKLLSPTERALGFYVKHNLEALLRGDPEARANYYTAALNPQTGWMHEDEVRALEDLNPLDEERYPDTAMDTHRR